MFEVYKNKRILITGVTGFKGSWLAIWLTRLGAKVSGFGLEPDTIPGLFRESGLAKSESYRITDIRNKTELARIIIEFSPEIIFHLASQPLVTVSYKYPFDTFETNVMGLVNLCEVIKESEFVRNIIFVTSDKCYLNKNTKKAFNEDDALGGIDPYSASKSCAELIAQSYAKSFFIKKGISSATVRAGNIIGGGDWSRDRLIPDIVRAIFENKDLTIRNPHHVRPWQHVLEALAGYLKTGEKLLCNKTADFTSWNFGPAEARDLNVTNILQLFLEHLDKKVDIQIPDTDLVYESEYLQLNSAKARNQLSWKNIWDTRTALEKTSEWYKMFYTGTKRAHELCVKQIEEYENTIYRLNK